MVCISECVSSQQWLGAQWGAPGAAGNSGTSDAVIFVMCFTTWMDGRIDGSMDG